jgi:hypothetical protein
MLITKITERFVYSDTTPDKRALLPKFINSKAESSEHVISIRESFGNKDRYEIIVYKKLNPYNYLYSCGKATASKVVEVAEKYNIEL